VDGNGEQARNWRRWFLLLWVAGSSWLLWQRWGAIHWFVLPDTDDNLRFAQVRAWIDGQGWYDLRQYRIDPPNGISVHWSRLVDLPLAALILLLRPVLGGADAARWACGIAPLLPLGAGLFGLMLVVRRLVDPWAYPLAAAILCYAGATVAMWSPMRIDHHGWQLATLILAVAGMADPRALRGGLVAGFASACSLAIGLELLPYLAVTGALVALWWVADRGQAPRLLGYGLALGAGTALGYLLFASWDNRAPRCDALTPVYLSTLVAAAAAATGLACLKAERRTLRLVAALAAGAAVAAFFTTAWPQCLGRPEAISPELDRLWFSHIREAKPLYLHPWRVSLPTAALSLSGLIGAWVAWTRARGSVQAMPWLLVALLSTFATALLLWQTRAGPASQLLGVIGATALGWLLMARALRLRLLPAQIAGVALAFVLVSGAFAGWIARAVPEQRGRYRQSVDLANRRCPTLPALRPIGQLPPATIFTFTDLGPRLVAVTRHSVVAGPYHRAGAAILDVQRAFRAKDPDFVRRVMRAHGATLLLICPGLSESTVYRSEAPQGFYAQLARGQVPAWLSPVALPKGSPFRLWRLAEAR